MRKDMKIIIGVLLPLFAIIVFFTIYNLDYLIASATGLLIVLVGGLSAFLGFVLIVLLILLCAALYFLPSIIALVRHHSNSTPVILVNVFLGWSFLGWVIALIWSFTDNRNV